MTRRGVGLRRWFSLPFWMMVVSPLILIPYARDGWQGVEVMVTLILMAMVWFGVLLLAVWLWEQR